MQPVGMDIFHGLGIVKQKKWRSDDFGLFTTGNPCFFYKLLEFSKWGYFGALKGL